MAKQVGYTVRQVKSGNWFLRVRDPAGRGYVSSGTFPTEADARRAGERLIADQEADRYVDPRKANITVEDALIKFLAGKRATGEHGARYAYLCEQLAADYILPRLGGYSLRDVKPLVVRSWRDDIVAARVAKAGTAGVAPAKAFRLLSAMLNQAVQDERIHSNPCQAVKGGGREDSAERTTLDPAEVTRIVEAVPVRYRALILVATYSGLRFGELAALQRRHIKGDEVTVEASITQVTGKGAVRKAPKTKAGRRTVVLPADVAAELAAHMAHFVGPEPDAPLFPAPRGGALQHANFGGAVWRPTLRKLGLVGVTFHDLRHTAATWAAQAGGTTAELMSRLGHASPDAAQRYQHAHRDRDRSLAGRMPALDLGPAKAS